MELESAPAKFHAFLHAADSHSDFSGRCTFHRFGKARSVALHGYGNRTGIEADANFGGGAVRILADIRKALLHNPKDSGLNVLRHPNGPPRQGQMNEGCAATRERPDTRWQR